MRKIISINPATEEANQEFEPYSEKRINRAIEEAKAAFSEWKNLDVSDRAEYLRNAASVLKRRKKELGEIITMEMGKLLANSISEIEKCAWALEYFAENAERFF